MKRFLFPCLLLVWLSCVSCPKDSPLSECYRTQIGTGENNCGPAVVSMVVAIKTDLNPTVGEVRQVMGDPYGNGLVSLEEIKSSLAYYDIGTVEFIDPVEFLMGLDNFYFIVLFYDTGASFGHCTLITGYQDRYFLAEDPYIGPNSHYEFNWLFDRIVFPVVGIRRER